MRNFFPICLWVACLSLTQACLAQLSIGSDWQERNGLTVASSQSVVVPATKLRFFANIESIDAEPQQAITDVNEKKKSAMAVLRKMGVQEQSVQFTAVKILEVEHESKRDLFWGSDSHGMLHGTDLESELNTAVMHLSFDISLDGMDTEKRILLFHNTYLRLRRDAVFELKEIEAVYVGEIEKSQIADARKKAYDEALADAKSLVSLTGKPLGKLAALTAGGGGQYASYFKRYPRSKMASYFVPSENEVFGADASKLKRTYSVELRFDLE